ncbi:hypothetical protein B0T20DRAFT_26092 [Sordaria brevicollis]|uniref:Uncharacterized protein n=1 Tax=Sordaria brevicollis TaxID=83679 RepID=A0AAE0PNT3_SORBR|nr:hypothetical protein B0T20DRAFT_26092 [Sordaria brevicollis]
MVPVETPLFMLTSVYTMENGASSLCNLCKRLSLTEMKGDTAQPHQPSYLALKQSVEAGCQLCGFIWTALGQCKSVDGIVTGAQVLERVSEEYPGREISFSACGLAAIDRGTSYLDYMDVYTSGEVPDCESDDETVDPTLHPDCQLALSGRLHVYAEEGQYRHTWLPLVFVLPDLC